MSTVRLLGLLPRHVFQEWRVPGTKPGKEVALFLKLQEDSFLFSISGCVYLWSGPLDMASYFYKSIAANSTFLCCEILAWVIRRNISLSHLQPDSDYS